MPCLDQTLHLLPVGDVVVVREESHDLIDVLPPTYAAVNVALCGKTVLAHAKSSQPLRAVLVPVSSLASRAGCMPPLTRKVILLILNIAQVVGAVLHTILDLCGRVSILDATKPARTSTSTLCMSRLIIAHTALCTLTTSNRTLVVLQAVAALFASAGAALDRMAIGATVVARIGHFVIIGLAKLAPWDDPGSSRPDAGCLLRR